MRKHAGDITTPFGLAADTVGRPIVLGGMDLRSIVAPVTVDGGAGNDSLAVVATGDAFVFGTGLTGTLSATNLTGLGMTGSGMNYNSFDALSISLGIGFDTV